MYLEPFFEIPEPCSGLYQGAVTPWGWHLWHLDGENTFSYGIKRGDQMQEDQSNSGKNINEEAGNLKIQLAE